MKNEQSIKQLKKEIEVLKLHKERELMKATSMREKAQLQADIRKLKEVQKDPKRFTKSFKTGLKMTGKGLGAVWRTIGKASRNIEASDKRLKQIPKKASPQALSPYGRMWLPNVEPTTQKKVKRKVKRRVKTKVRTIKRRPKTRVVTRTVYREPKPVRQLMPWEEI